MEEVLRHWLDGDDYVHKSAGFMSAVWDSFVPGPSVWQEAYRVLKPGGHLIAFFGTRTYDMGVMALRLAGFEIRDQLAWVFGSGFPKSHDVSKGIDKAAGAEREVISERVQAVAFDTEKAGGGGWSAGVVKETRAATPEAARWSGWGTALKPAFEPIVLCRKPLSEPTVAANVLRWGTGAVNIDACRVGTSDKLGGGMVSMGRPMVSEGWDRPWMHDPRVTDAKKIESARKVAHAQELGRWPANLAHDGSDEVLAGFPVTGASKRAIVTSKPGGIYGGGQGLPAHTGEYGYDEPAGSAARFFYCAKASKSDRNEGLDDMPVAPSAASQFRPNHAEGAANGESGNPYGRWSPVRNIHPTVKPTALMQWLVRMVTPTGGIVLDPFTGSGSTGKAAILEGFNFVGCEMTPEYAEIARRRIDHAVNSR